MKLKPGDLIRHGPDVSCIYLFATVSSNHTALISITNGNRWSDVSMGWGLTLEQLSAITDEYWEYVGRFE